MGDGESVAQGLEIGQVDGLGDQTKANDAQTNLRHGELPLPLLHSQPPVCDCQLVWKYSYWFV